LFRFWKMNALGLRALDARRGNASSSPRGLQAIEFAVMGAAEADVGVPSDCKMSLSVNVTDGTRLMLASGLAATVGGSDIAFRKSALMMLQWGWNRLKFDRSLRALLPRRVPLFTRLLQAPKCNLRSWMERNLLAFFPAPSACVGTTGRSATNSQRCADRSR